LREQFEEVRRAEIERLGRKLSDVERDALDRELLGPGVITHVHRAIRRQQRRIVLLVGVHHRHDRSGGGADPLDRRAGEAAPADPLDRADAAVGLRDPSELLGGAVAAVVIDEDRFPGHAGKRSLEAGDHRANIGALVVSRQDDRKLEGGRLGHHLGCFDKLSMSGCG